MYNLTQNELGKIIGVSQASVHHYIRKMNLTESESESASPDKNLSDLLVLAIGELRATGLSGHEAALLLGGCKTRIADLFEADGKRLYVVKVSSPESQKYFTADTLADVGAIAANHPRVELIALHEVLGRAVLKLLTLCTEGTAQ